MPRVPDKDIAQFALQAGFRGSEVATAVAVALGESGGNSDATFHERDGSTSYGLMQINSTHTTLLNGGNWRDPAANMRMAFSIFTGRSRTWKDWGAFNNGRYLLYMPRGVAAAALAGNDLVTGGADKAIGGVIEEINPLDDVVQAFRDVKTGLAFITDPHNWLRLGMILFGAILLAIVIWPMIRETRAAQAAVDTVKAVV